MKISTLILVLAAGLFAAAACPEQASAQHAAAIDATSSAMDAANNKSLEDYKLVWADEFNKDGPLDGKDWAYETGFVRNQELQWYQAENAICKDGFLVIEAKKERKPNPRYVAPAATAATEESEATGDRLRPGRRGAGWQNRESIEYTSASVNTRGKHAWLYGRFEIRAKIDIRAGSWPAFWTLGTQGRWPANGEIDIMEYYRQTVLANVAWAGGTPPAKRDTWNTKRMPLSSFPKNWAENFHTWRMDWDRNFIKLYLDDAEVNSQDLSKTINAPAQNAFGGSPGQTPENPFHTPAYILLNQAIGGTQGGDTAATEFPVRFVVDYVRVWQIPSQREKATSTGEAKE
ncbi:MAG: glycoside hydrolase family 16 protein [Thermoguttaceae bacterium]